jgi:hypothetical protein
MTEADLLNQVENPDTYWYLASGLVVAQMETWDTSYGVGVEREEFASQGKPEILIPWSVFGGGECVTRL